MEAAEIMQMLVDFLYWLNGKGDPIMSGEDYQPFYHQAAHDFLAYALPRGVVSVAGGEN